jgi:hypothetical protein
MLSNKGNFIKVKKDDMPSLQVNSSYKPHVFFGPHKETILSLMEKKDELKLRWLVKEGGVFFYNQRQAYFISVCED